MSTSDNAGYLGRLRSSTRPNQDTHETGRARSRLRSRSRSRSRDLRRREPAEEGSGDETSDGPQDKPPDSPSKRDELSARAEKEADQPPADSGAFRRQLSPVPGKRHQLASPCSTKRHRRHLGSARSTERHPQSARNRGAHVGTSDLSSEAKQVRQALEDARQTTLRRIARQRLNDGDFERAKRDEREASVEAGRAHQAPAQAVASAAAGATAVSSPSTRPQGVASQKERPGDGAF